MTADLRPIAILGGAGFIGANLAAHLARTGHRVRIYDNLSRAGVERNLAWLRETHGPRIETVIADVRDQGRLRAALAGTAAVFHFAGQTAVDALHDRGIDERRPVEPRTPYGTEDQGWVAHFLIDVLFVDDLVDAFVRAWQQIEVVRGRAFNIGGGARHTLSLLELVDEIARQGGRRPELRFEDWRAGDQRYYVSDTATYTAATSWRPLVAPRAGARALHGWFVAQADGPGAVRGGIHA